VMSIITADRLAGQKTKETGWQDELYWQVLTGAERDWRALAGAGWRNGERSWVPAAGATLGLAWRALRHHGRFLARGAAFPLSWRHFRHPGVTHAQGAVFPLA
jgi:hypothetical protein